MDVLNLIWTWEIERSGFFPLGTTRTLPLDLDVLRSYST